jgi:acyl-CoA reductase-like NAD-dependent aldehyde dehydrogenase
MGALKSVEESGRRIVSRNPASGEVLGEAAVFGPAEVRAAVERARTAQKEWGARNVRDRAEALLGLRRLLVDHAGELCDLLTRETGKTRVESFGTELFPVCDLLTYFCKRAEKILAPQTIALHLLKTRASYVHYAPRGVVGIISPWNFPFAIAAGEMVMALLAGNAVVHKPSDVTPLIAQKTKELFDQSGLPRDLYQVVTGRGETGAALIDAGIDYCVFTGSTATGRKVAAACGERLIPVALELGGNAAAIVCADADLERTARALVWGAFCNQGQVCASVERAYAHAAVYDELVEKVVALTRTLRQGDPSQSEDLDVGVMTWEHQVEIVEQRIGSAVAAGARLRAGGRRGASGLAFLPTVITECRQEMEIMQKEIFGPVLPIMKVRDEEEAIALANDSPSGLLGYVFTDDRQKGRRIAERLEVGSAVVNDVLITFAVPETPWAGIKQSGIGRTHSDEGLRDLCQARHVNYDRLSFGRELWWYPYSGKLYSRGLKLLRWLFR